MVKSAQPSEKPKQLEVISVGKTEVKRKSKNNLWIYGELLNGELLNGELALIFHF